MQKEDTCDGTQEELLLNVLATLSNYTFEQGQSVLVEQSDRIVGMCLDVLMEQGSEETVLEGLRVLCNLSRDSRRSTLLQGEYTVECLVLLVAHHLSEEVVESASRVLLNAQSPLLPIVLERHREDLQQR